MQDGDGGTARAGADFVAMISHELREPMNGVLGMARLLRETPLDAEQGAYLEALIASGETLVTLVNDLLDWSRLDADRLAFNPTVFALRPFFERIAAYATVRARPKGLDFNLELGPDLPDLVRGDPGRLRQILINLAGNAIKFTSEGFVRLKVAPAPAGPGRTGLLIEVEDTGIGIPDAAAARLFGAYAQADADVERAYGGSGLGLMIAQRLAGVMHGAIRPVPGRERGALFEVRIELDRAEAGANPGGRATLAGALALVVDPTARSREVMTTLAKLWGLSPRGAASGAEAIGVMHEALGRAAAFDFVLVERGIADITAEDLVRRARAAGHAHARFVLLAGAGVRGDAARAREAGFDAYLPSPASASTLLDCLQRLRGGGEGDLLTIHDLAERRGRRLRLLVVDDNPVNRKLLDIMLGKLGHAVATATNGAEALDALDEGSFDAVLMDVQMPVMDGITATRRIRERVPPTGAVPIIAITANAMQGDDDACRAAGMDGYVPKPVERARLVAELERLTAA